MKTQETKHTPGPWHLSESGLEVRCTDKVGAFNVTVAACYAPALSEAEHKANAQLIAAAPELLAALTSISSALDKGKDQWATEITVRDMADARAALAKATGE